MVWSDLLLFSPVILGSVGFVASKLPDIIDAVTGDDQAPFERFTMDARRRGLDYAGMSLEWEVRTIFARLGREASDAVARDIENWQSVLESAVQKGLADNPNHARELKGMMQGLSYGHILYPVEASMVERLYSDFHQRLHGGYYTIDRRAALRLAR